uniref:Uncharacterized protein n=1 Tax=Arundo donax TaxID=35708 RepID=A0A0A9E705_ARUDO
MIPPPKINAKKSPKNQ